MKTSNKKLRKIHQQTTKGKRTMSEDLKIIEKEIRERAEEELNNTLRTLFPTGPENHPFRQSGFSLDLFLEKLNSTLKLSQTGKITINCPLSVINGILKEVIFEEEISNYIQYEINHLLKNLT
jgi:hypothetical protein